MFKNYTGTFLFLLLLILTANQTVAQQGNVASGGDATGGGGSVAYSVGQVAYNTQIGSSGSVTQGVQQPFEISSPLGVQEEGIQLMMVSPNPTRGLLQLYIPTLEGKMRYELFDINARRIASLQISESITTLDLERFAAATYFLKVFRNKTEIKTFKVIKN
jgi:hypothetical protein